MSQTGCECVSVSVVTGFDVCNAAKKFFRTEYANPVLLLSVVDVVSRVRVDEFRQSDFVVTFQADAFG
jgi:hypothetical protein